MAEENKDQVSAELGEAKPEQSEEKQSEETEEKPSIEKVAELVKALQKGYTETRQEFAETREQLQAIADSINAKSGATSGEDEYLTVGKLKSILSEQTANQEQVRSQADAYIDSALTQLRAEGKVTNAEEENELLQYALKLKEPDLIKAANIWQDIKNARTEAKKDAVKSKVRQEEGSKIGTSSKATTGEQGGVDYRKVRNMDWFQF